MRRQATLQGRSFVFNLLSATIHFGGVFLLGMAFLPGFFAWKTTFLMVGGLLFVFGLAGILIFRGRLMMSMAARWMAGSLLLVSALVKINDPVGFAYKLEEYFQDGALAYRFKVWLNDPSISFEALQSYALPLAIFLCIAELIIGLYLLVGGARRFVSYGLVLLMLFFTFLTWHTASCDPNSSYKDRNEYNAGTSQARSLVEKSKKDKNIRLFSKTPQKFTFEETKKPQCVTDCGCFGDALRGSMGRSLMPVESLMKDIWLLYLAIWIFIAQWITKPNSREENIFFLIASFFVFSFMAWLLEWFWIPMLLSVLIITSLWLRRAGGKFLGNDFGTALVPTLAGLSMVSYVLLYEPLKDYRPFALGSDIHKKMNDGVQGKSIFRFVLRNKSTGKEEIFGEAEYLNNSALWDEKKYRFLRRIEQIITPGRLPSITDQFDPFRKLSEISDDELLWKVVRDSVQAHDKYLAVYEHKETGKMTTVDPQKHTWITRHPDYQFRAKKRVANSSNEVIKIVDALLKEPKIVLLCSERLQQGNWNQINSYRMMSKMLAKREIPFVLLTASSSDQIVRFKKEYVLHIPAFQNDMKGLQMISRSNPCIMVLKYGRVVAKYPFRMLPTDKELLKVLK